MLPPDTAPGDIALVYEQHRFARRRHLVARAHDVAFEPYTRQTRPLRQEHQK